jgi:hypothetical protein
MKPKYLILFVLAVMVLLAIGVGFILLNTQQIMSSLRPETIQVTFATEHCCASSITTNYPGIKDASLDLSAWREIDGPWNVILSGEYEGEPESCERAGSYNFSGRVYHYEYAEGQVFVESVRGKNWSTTSAPYNVLIFTHVPLEMIDGGIENFHVNGTFELVVEKMVFICTSPL